MVITLRMEDAVIFPSVGAAVAAMVQVYRDSSAVEVEEEATNSNRAVVVATFCKQEVRVRARAAISSHRAGQ